MVKCVPGSGDGGVRVLAGCRLTADPGPWDYEIEHAEAIVALWERRRIDRPEYFDGVVYLISDIRLTGNHLDARLVATRFKSYLHWREAGFPEAGVRDGFGSAIVISADGRVLLGRQRFGNVNAGQAYLPGGFIDDNDIGIDGSVDIEASIIRELGEETGLAVSEAVRMPDLLVCRSGPQLAIAVGWHFAETAAELAERIRGHILVEATPELEDALFVGPEDELGALRIPPYARALLRHVFAAR